MRVLIVGAGEVGYYLASRLSTEGHDVVVVDRDAEAIRRLESLDIQLIQGSGSSPGILEEAGVRSANMVVAVTDSDEVNMVACLFANVLNRPATKIARIRDTSMTRYPHLLDQNLLNVSVIINPEQEVAKSVLNLLAVPGASDVVDLAGGLVKLIGLRVPPRSPLAGKTLMDLGQNKLAEHFLVAAITRGEAMIIPRGQDKIHARDLVYLIIQPAVVKEVMELFGANPFTLKRVMIVGGGSLGFTLAKALEDLPVAVKLLDCDNNRCSFLAEHLDKVTILHGDGTDKSLLQEENINQTDAMIVVTEDEEENILISLLGQQMGVRQTITRISKMAYQPLVEAIGLDRVISPRLAAANAILQYIRRGKVLSVTQIKGEEAEVIEFVALETSDVVGRPLAELKFPAGAIIGAIVRGSTMIVPKGDTVVQPEDRVIILAQREAIPKVEKALTVKFYHF